MPAGAAGNKEAPLFPKAHFSLLLRGRTTSALNCVTLLCESRNPQRSREVAATGSGVQQSNSRLQTHNSSTSAHENCSAERTRTSKYQRLTILQSRVYRLPQASRCTVTTHQALTISRSVEGLSLWVACTYHKSETGSCQRSLTEPRHVCSPGRQPAAEAKESQ